MKYLFLMLWASSCFAGEFIDTVYSYKFGINVDCGQDTMYFPKNIFGPPSINAKYETPAAMPSEVLCIGFGGEIVIGIKEKIILDEPGFDFKIFENAFLNPINSKIFAEPAIVSVSQDGINYFDFPFDYSTLKGCAGITPVIGSNDPFSQDTISGDGFDLKTIGLSWVKYIKIKDITNEIYKDKSHLFYDISLSGFDLDAVAILHLGNLEATSVKSELSNFSINASLFIANQPVNLTIYDLNGIEIYNNNNCLNLNLNQFKSQFLLVKVISNANTSYTKYINLGIN